ncbi:hypothetical protein [Hoeflea sp. BAL378]|uniref:hypothetical protein n=1 Tax=Hoeflea sp. BAL378 TaxID=1547437 RepID=UPI00068AF926|nr:hypothetical protein [Hoeflea sp. BAL378]
MISKLLKTLTGSLKSPSPATPEALSRRAFLFGGCAAIGAVYVASKIGVSAASAAGLAPLSTPEAGDAGVELAQYRDDLQRRRDDNGFRRRDDNGFRRDDNRRRWRDDRGPRRMSRRDVERECRQSNRFRHDNRQLCRQVTGRRLGRSGTCVQFGPLQICE